MTAPHPSCRLKSLRLLRQRLVLRLGQKANKHEAEEEQAGADDVEGVVKSLLAGEPEALKMQKQLLQLWEEAPLSASIRTSIGLFQRAYASGIPGKRMR